MAITSTEAITVNTTTLGGKQDAVQTVALANGGYVTAWNTDIGGQKDVMFQRFDAAGNPVGAAKLANAAVAGDQVLRDIVATADGDFSLVWTTGKTVTARSFDSNGNAASAETNVSALGPAATGVQIVAVSDTQYKVFITSNSGGATVVEQATFNTTGGVAVAKAAIAAAGLPTGASVIEAVDGNTAGTQFLLLNNGAVVSSADGSAFNAGVSTDLLKLQNGVDVLGSSIFQDVQLTAMFGVGNNLSTYSLGTPQASNLVDIGAVNPDLFDSALVDLGGNRVLAISVVYAGSAIGGVVKDGIYAVVYNANTGVYESQPFLVRDLGAGDASAVPNLSAIRLEADLMADGRVSLSWSEFNGLTGFDVFNSIIDAGGGPHVVSGTFASGDMAGDAVSYVASASGVRVDLTYDVMNSGDAKGDHMGEISTIIGSSFDDKLRGSESTGAFGSGNDNLSGGDGNDHLVGRSGDDRLDGGTGDDAIHGGTGDDIIFGGDGRDVIYSDDGDDAIDGGSGNDFISGGTGDDVLDGGDGNDSISAGNGDSIIDGGTGNDFIIAGSGQNIIDGGTGTDAVSYVLGSGVYVDLDYTLTVIGSLAGYDVPNDILVSIENIVGSGGGDYLAGSAGVNVLRGGGGDDILQGRGGADRLAGGDGADTFAYESIGDGGDKITDYTVGSDHILIVSENFGDINAGNILANFQANSNGTASGTGPKLTFDDSGIGFGNLYYDADGGGIGARVLLATISIASDQVLLPFSAGDFVFV